MPLASVREPIRKLCRGRARNLLAQRRRNAVKKLARLPPLTLTPHGAPQMPPILPRIAPLGLVSSACWSTVGSASYGVPYLQQVTSTQGRCSINGRVFSRAVAGFSMTHMSGSKCSMISRAQVPRRKQRVVPGSNFMFRETTFHPAALKALPIDFGHAAAGGPAPRPAGDSAALPRQGQLPDSADAPGLNEEDRVELTHYFLRLARGL